MGCSARLQKRRSCESQLVLKTQDLAVLLNSRSQTDAILMDFSKALHKVPQRRMSLKLHYYGVRSNILEWVMSFLYGRTQQVVLDGIASSAAAVTSGVTKGSARGPLLFIAYINDLPSCVKSNTRLFADDCLLYRRINSADAKAL